MQIDKLNLEVGKAYSARMKGYEIDDEEGNVFIFIFHIFTYVRNCSYHNSTREPYC